MSEKIAQVDWEFYRSGLPYSKKLYFNSGYITAPPQVVTEKVASLQNAFSQNPYGVLSKSKFREYYWEVFREAAWFLGAPAPATVSGQDQSAIALVANTTMGLSLLASGLTLPDGAEVLIGQNEYFTSRLAWEYRLARQPGLKLVIAKFPQVTALMRAEEIIEWYRTQIGAGTRVLVLSHIAYDSGLMLPIKAICVLVAELNSERSPEQRIYTIIDGVQALGAIPVDVTDLGCDFYVSGTHKWVLGPHGCGFLYTRPGLEGHVVPILPSFVSAASSWTHDMSAMAERRGGLAMTPGGTYAFEYFWALPTIIDYHRQIGRENIAARIRGLASYLRAGLSKLGVELITPSAPELSAGLTVASFGEVANIFAYLEEQGVVARLFPEQGAIRFSTHFFNTEAQIDQLLVLIAKVL